MRVALYAGAFKENQDGATRSLYQLVRSLQADGMQVGVWSYDRTPSPLASWVTQFTVPSLPLPLYPAYRISLPGNDTLRQLDQFRPDLIHIAVADDVGIDAAVVGFAEADVQVPLPLPQHPLFQEVLTELVQRPQHRAHSQSDFNANHGACQQCLTCSLETTCAGPVTILATVSGSASSIRWPRSMR